MTKDTEKRKKNSIIDRKDIFDQIKKDINGPTTAIILKGPGGVGKSVILERLVKDLKKKSFDTIKFNGNTSAEFILKKLTKKALERGIPDAENLFTAPVEYKEKLKKILDNLIFKEKFLIIFEDFDENQTAEGEFLNERLKELLLYLKDELKDKKSKLIFCTTTDIPKIESIEINPITWEEFLELINQTNILKKLPEKQLEYIYFEMGGFPRMVELLDKIAQYEFSNQSFDWAKLRERIPTLTERIMHKEHEHADFSYLLFELLLKQLSPSQQDLLNSICIFRGNIAMKAVKALQQDIKIQDQKKLEQLSLIRFDEKNKEFRVPRLVAKIVRSQLDENDSKQKNILAAKYFENLRSIPNKEDTIKRQSKIEFYNDEYAQNARWHYIEAGQFDTAIALSFKMDNYYSSIGFPQFAFDLLQEMEKFAAETSEINQIRLHVRLGAFYSVFGKLDEALKQHETCLKITKSRGDQQGIALNLSQMGLILEAKGKDDEALKKLQEALIVIETLENKNEIARILDKIGSIQKRLGDYPSSFENYKRALEIHQKLDNQKEIGINLEQMGRIHDEQGKFDVAMDYYKDSLEIKEILNDQPGIASLVHQMGNVLFFKGNLDESFSLYKRSLQIKEEIKDHKGAGYSLGQLGLIYQKRGSNTEALSYFEGSLKKFEEAKEEKGIAASHHQIGRIQEGTGNQDLALNHYEKALEIREKIGDMLGAALTYGQLGMLYYQKKEYETALQYSTQAFAIFSRYGSPNAELARNNMLRIRQHFPKEKFDEVLKQYNIKTEPENKK